MLVPNLHGMGPTGFYPPQDRVVLAGRGWNANHPWATVAANAVRYMAMEVLPGYSVVVWSVSIGIETDQIGNKPAAAILYAGELTGGSVVTPSKMLDSQPDQVGFVMEQGDTLAGGATQLSKSVHNFGRGNILDGIRVFNAGTKVALGLQNLDVNAASLMTMTALLAIFSVTNSAEPVLV